MQQEMQGALETAGSSKKQQEVSRQQRGAAGNNEEHTTRGKQECASHHARIALSPIDLRTALGTVADPLYWLAATDPVQRQRWVEDLV